MSTKTRPKRNGKRSPFKPRRHAVNFVVWNMSGGPIPESVVQQFDDAMQKVMDDNQQRVRLLATTVKV